MPMIDEFYAFVCEEAPGEEGLCAFYTPNGWMPMVAADKARVESLRPIAQTLAANSGLPIRLLRFTSREEVERIT